MWHPGTSTLSQQGSKATFLQGIMDNENVRALNFFSFQLFMHTQAVCTFADSYVVLQVIEFLRAQGLLLQVFEQPGSIFHRR